MPTWRAAGVHRLTDHEERWASVGGVQRATDVVGDLGPGGFEHVRRRHDSFDCSRGEKSSVTPKHTANETHVVAITLLHSAPYRARRLTGSGRCAWRLLA